MGSSKLKISNGFKMTIKNFKKNREFRDKTNW